MPLVGMLLGQQIALKMTQKGFTGSQQLNFANAVGNGVITNILATNIYNGTTLGTGPGPGTGTGKISGLVGPVVGQNIFTMMTARGFAGSQQLNTAMAIGEAFAEHILSFGIVNALGGPTAIGTGTGPIVGIVGTLMGQSILTYFSTAGFTGSQILNTAMAIGDGIALSMALALVTTTIVGVPAPPPAGPVPIGGVETGKLT